MKISFVKYKKGIYQPTITWKLLLCVPWSTSSIDRSLRCKTAPEADQFSREKDSVFMLALVEVNMQTERICIISRQQSFPGTVSSSGFVGRLKTKKQVCLNTFLGLSENMYVKWDEN